MDEYGLYVRTGGYVFRPPKNTKFGLGETVLAHHIGGTQKAIVYDETWHSFSADPQYIRYVQPKVDKADVNSNPLLQALWDGYEKKWQEYLNG